MDLKTPHGGASGMNYVQRISTAKLIHWISSRRAPNCDNSKVRYNKACQTVHCNYNWQIWEGKKKIHVCTHCNKNIPDFTVLMWLNAKIKHLVQFCTCIIAPEFTHTSTNNNKNVEIKSPFAVNNSEYDEPPPKKQKKTANRTYARKRVRAHERCVHSWDQCGPGMPAKQSAAVKNRPPNEGCEVNN